MDSDSIFLKHISELVGFNYTIAVTKGYGSLDPKTGKWNGMINELLEEVNLLSSEVEVN